MLIFLSRMRRRLANLRIGLPAAVLVIVVFATSWPLMAVAEPAGSQIVQPETYWWWFVVTGATVGYGDHFPVTTGGHLVGTYVIIGGITALTTLFSQLATAIERTRGRRMQGAVTVEASDHIVVLGYLAGRTERIIDSLLADGRHPIVLASWEDVEAHPMPDRDVTFVRGNLIDPDVLRRAGIHRAYGVLVDARDDQEALALTVSVHHVSPSAHLVVALRDLSRADHLRYVRDDVHCVEWHTPRMASEELQDPGITQMYMELMTHGGGNTYSMRLPPTLGTVMFGDCQLAFGRTHDATILAVRTDDDLLVNPSWEMKLPAGSMLYYISRQRLDPDEIETAIQRH